MANITRPDLSNAARELGKVAADPTMRHWKSILHVLRYISSTSAYGLLYPNIQEEKLKMIGYSDSDFANDPSSRLSCTGYVIKLGNAIIDWTSRTQRTIATSTAEAEWIALSTGTRHAEYLRGFMNELGIDIENVVWWCDNASTVVTATTPGHTGRTQHLDVKLKKTREMVIDGIIIIKYIPGNKQEADGLTKRLDRVSHEKLRGYLMAY